MVSKRKYVGQRICVFFKKDRMLPNFKGYETAVKNKMKVGIIQGNSYHSSFWKAFPYKDGSTSFQGEYKKNLNSQLEEARQLASNLRKLAVGRIDIFPADKTYVKEKGSVPFFSFSVGIVYGLVHLGQQVLHLFGPLLFVLFEGTFMCERKGVCPLFLFFHLA